MNFRSPTATFGGTSLFPPLAIGFYDQRGTEGIDFLFGDYRNNRIYGLGGNDVLFGGSGNDSIYGMDGDDYLAGDDGDDYLSGGDGNDFLIGGNGADYLVAGRGNDTLFGGEGNDTLSSLDTEGYKVLDGGGGNDLIILSANPYSMLYILNYEAGDRIQIDGDIQEYFVGSGVLNSQGLTEFGIYLNGNEQRNLLAIVTGSQPFISPSFVS
jgi:Ca2+-binding RTX toxin-like protein